MKKVDVRDAATERSSMVVVELPCLHYLWSVTPTSGRNIRGMCNCMALVRYDGADMPHMSGKSRIDFLILDAVFAAESAEKE